ncbi:hypothetical protein E2C01_085471 [Portunus trituberculatus]|uniref:Uncharacterized protein n=1 Tax=Portunus trituberculatus TaxID=210409 RepID=A0A5B7J2T2_PORTR|nr:hypothetical protein [Portunus trituberculatus]
MEEVRVEVDRQWEGQEKVEGVCDRGRESVGNRRMHGTRSPVVESSRRPANPKLNGEMWTLSENDNDDDDDDDDDLKLVNCIFVFFLSIG